LHQLCEEEVNYTRSAATAEIVHDAEMAIQQHSRSSIIVPITVASMTSY